MRSFFFESGVKTYRTRLLDQHRQLGHIIQSVIYYHTLTAAADRLTRNEGMRPAPVLIHDHPNSGPNTEPASKMSRPRHPPGETGFLDLDRHVFVRDPIYLGNRPEYPLRPSQRIDRLPSWMRLARPGLKSAGFLPNSPPSQIPRPPAYPKCARPWCRSFRSSAANPRSQGGNEDAPSDSYSSFSCVSQEGALLDISRIAKLYRKPGTPVRQTSDGPSDQACPNRCRPLNGPLLHSPAQPPGQSLLCLSSNLRRFKRFSLPVLSRRPEAANHAPSCGTVCSRLSEGRRRAFRRFKGDASGAVSGWEFEMTVFLSLSSCLYLDIARQPVKAHNRSTQESTTLPPPTVPFSVGLRFAQRHKVGHTPGLDGPFR